MNKDTNARLKLIGDLVNFRGSTEASVRSLSKLEWDYEGERFVLSRDHLLSALQRFIVYELSASELEQWANAIEGRDDIELDAAHKDLLSDSIHELANPILTAELTLASANEMTQKLRA